MRISDWSSDVCSSDLHAVRFLQRGGNVGDVADTEGNRIGVEKLVGKRQLLGILFGPDERIDAALGRTLHADAEHVGIDVGDGDAGSETLHAKGDVAGAARHVEARLAIARLYAAHEAVFPQPGPPAPHRAEP